MQESAGVWRCRGPEQCNNGFDDDWDGMTDCADFDCIYNGPNPYPSPNIDDYSGINCTGTNQTGEICAKFPAFCTYTGAQNPPPNGVYYCSQGQGSTSTTGVCCPAGQEFKQRGSLPFDWGCFDSAQCYDPLNPNDLNCHHDYEGNAENYSAWWDSTRDNIADSLWCVDTVTQSPSLACCKVLEFAELDFYSDQDNVKIY